MSAFVVSKEHIDALVAAAVQPPHPGWDAGGYVPLRELEEGEKQPAGHEYEAPQGYLYFHISFATADALGRLLWWECVRSVGYRYPSRDGDAELARLPGYGYTLADYEGYRFNERAIGRLSGVETLKALDCYEYQSCEHPGWRTSEAKKVCDWLRGKLVASLPGYDEAAWSIEPQGDECVGLPSV